MESKDARTWQLQLFGKFELRAPDGRLVKLPTRKNEGLLAILALNRAEGMSRVSLGQSLWPDKGLENRQANLRQCIAKLRAALGPEAISATRERCRLSESFRLQCDADRAPNHAVTDRGVFLLDFSEPWFNERRRVFEPDVAIAPAHEQATGIMPLESFTQLLNWYAHKDPGRAMDLLRANRDLGHGMRPNDLRKIAEIAEPRFKPGELSYGWLLYWKGLQTLVSEDLDSARPMLQSAATIGQEHRDIVLEIEAGICLSVIGIVIGHMNHAEKVAARCASIATGTSDPVLLGRVDALMGTILVHQGRTQEGLLMLEKAAKGFENNMLEFAQNESLRALYHATIGEVEQADRLVADPERIGIETRHFRLEMICSLVRALIAIKVGEPEAATKLLDVTLAKSSDGDSKHFVIYSREALAVAAWMQRDREGTTDQLKSSDRLRRTLRMAYTGWDQLRLAELRKRP